MLTLRWRRLFFTLALSPSEKLKEDLQAAGFP